jgi:ferrous iron transport protein A
MPELATPVSLSALRKGMRGVVASIAEDSSVALGEESETSVVMRLIEIGFVPGEPVEVIAEARPGGDPIAVRIGGSCFALRRSEAAAVMVRVDP